MLKENYLKVEENIKAACERSGRKIEEITLIAVSKTRPYEDIIRIYDAGQRDFGENRVQELTRKFEELPEDIRWHMIGHLQQNKVRQVIDKTVLIHSVDSLRLAETISKEAQKKQIIVDILIEVNVAEEETKFGIKVDETVKLIEKIASLPAIKICGLMTIAPFVENPEENRDVFRKLKQLSIDIEGKKIDNVSMKCLSMGMTNDYTVAIEEGATCIRVGTAIFGNRHYM